MTQQHAVVVGAGIGGLGAALGLRKVGWRVTVLERAQRFAPVGAGITLMPNALRALDELGVGAEFRELAPVQTSGGLRSGSGRWLSRWAGAAVQRLLGAPMIALHRAQLHEMLRNALPPESVRTGVEVVGVDVTDGGRLRVQHTDPADVDAADLVVAADGIDSRLRTQLWPEVPGPAYCGVTTWRGIAPAPPGPPLEVTQSWGRGSEFGVVPLADGRIYWFGAVEAPPGAFVDDERGAARAQFGDWHRPIPELIDTSDVVLHHDIEHLPALPRSFVRGRVVLLGDAAHAMTPHLGQGGCQALEDGVVLAAVLAEGRDVEAADVEGALAEAADVEGALAEAADVGGALARYDQQRRPRVEAVVRAAAQLRRMNALTDPFAVAARNTLVRLTPSALGVCSMARISRWNPPEIRGQE